MAQVISPSHSTPTLKSDDDSAQKWTFILVRHGEKQAGSDPELNEQGTLRAQRLADMLQHIPLNKVYSTDYRRTQLTAEPTAKSQSLPVTSYDPSDLEGFSQTLMQQPGRYLIVGHGNTMIVLAKKLSLQADFAKMDYTEDYDRMYFIEVNIIDGKRTNSVYRFSY
ncbi:histidine phosphatase family protein [Shewanella subflava]|uniref:Histidine phosphatase family protein n=1 Tax=Shewanella subflava TaxID=2986476 RepID=A0ABT3IDA9_9GAMM|nr:histidine phosphatase family protein [Shewanella subflava]MCW3174032.1 histidine phosphatase family protein [Shewanella subflava]